MNTTMTLVMIPKEQLDQILNSQLDILQQLKELNTKGPTGVLVKNIPAIDYMTAVGIKRTKFDELVKTNKIKTIKKKRKVYVPVTEIDRYFNDPSIQ